MDIKSKILDSHGVIMQSYLSINSQFDAHQSKVIDMDLNTIDIFYLSRWVKNGLVLDVSAMAEVGGGKCPLYQVTNGVPVMISEDYSTRYSNWHLNFEEIMATLKPVMAIYWH